jgi:hypothetical protein
MFHGMSPHYAITSAPCSLSQTALDRRVCGHFDSAGPPPGLGLSPDSGLVTGFNPRSARLALIRSFCICLRSSANDFPFAVPSTGAAWRTPESQPATNPARPSTRRSSNVQTNRASRINLLSLDLTHGIGSAASEAIGESRFVFNSASGAPRSESHRQSALTAALSVLSAFPGQRWRPEMTQHNSTRLKRSRSLFAHSCA